MRNAAANVGTQESDFKYMAVEGALSGDTPAQRDAKIISDVSDLVVKIGSPRKPGDPHIKKDEEGMSLHIWDFAGHDLYYTTHQVRLTNKQ